eukprot:TRINITY_DN46649_c0_g1_i3.p1 TRINITY_DN46649_c0_g1~~TRINITY_DN46649_c0_g1_i3.p1  ORF type:complete len:464 (-),score=35.81 TRINITY_DN46649_c0_g1_i3:364-1755(-)
MWRSRRRVASICSLSVVTIAVALNLAARTSFVGLRGHAKVRCSGTPMPRRSVHLHSQLSGLDAALDSLRQAESDHAFSDLGLRFPNISRVIFFLESVPKQDFDDDFLTGLHEVLVQLHAWPSAWPGIVKLLHPRYAWTQPYCEKVMGSSAWTPFPFCMIDWQPLSPLLRRTINELSSAERNLLASWFAKVSSEDSTAAQLVMDVEAQDVQNQQENTLRLQALESLLKHLNSKVIRHLFETASSYSDTVVSGLSRRDFYGQTVLHLAASQGNNEVTNAILGGLPEVHRAKLIGAEDNDGYTAEALAQVAEFVETATLLRTWRQAEPVSQAAMLQPSKNVRMSDGRDIVQESLPESRDSLGCGGWQMDDSGWVPPEWLPEDDSETGIDVMHISAFNYTCFQKQYLRPGRPLLIRGGVQLEEDILRCYTREGLLQVAGNRNVTVFNLPYLTNLPSHINYQVRYVTE